MSKGCSNTKVSGSVIVGSHTRLTFEEDINTTPPKGSFVPRAASRSARMNDRFALQAVQVSPLGRGPVDALVDVFVVVKSPRPNISNPQVLVYPVGVEYQLRRFGLVAADREFFCESFDFFHAPVELNNDIDRPASGLLTRSVLDLGKANGYLVGADFLFYWQFIKTPFDAMPGLVGTGCRTIMGGTLKSKPGPMSASGC